MSCSADVHTTRHSRGTTGIDCYGRAMFKAIAMSSNHPRLICHPIRNQHASQKEEVGGNGTTLAGGCNGSGRLNRYKLFF